VLGKYVRHVLYGGSYVTFFTPDRYQKISLLLSQCLRIQKFKIFEFCMRMRCVGGDDERAKTMIAMGQRLYLKAYKFSHVKNSA